MQQAGRQGSSECGRQVWGQGVRQAEEQWGRQAGEEGSSECGRQVAEQGVRQAGED